MHHASARRYIYLSISAAIATMAVKFAGFLITGSVGLFSDAAESIVNLIAALVALWAITLAARPADTDHAYGHHKAEYFSSAAEGLLILIAAIVILIEAVPRLFDPHPLEQVSLGLLFAVIGALINGIVGWFMARASKRLRSVTLQADAHHLFTDVFTTVGILVGIVLISLTGWLILDPLIAILVALNILWTGLKLLRESGLGLLDTVLPAEDREQIETILNRYRKQNLLFHALRTRRAGSRRFISFHVLVPGSWSVSQGHDICEQIEHDLREVLPESTIFTHLEPADDPRSWADQTLDRHHNSTSEEIKV